MNQIKNLSLIEIVQMNTYKVHNNLNIKISIHHLKTNKVYNILRIKINIHGLRLPKHLLINQLKLKKHKKNHLSSKTFNLEKYHQNL